MTHQDSPMTSSVLPDVLIGISPMTHQDSPMTHRDSPMTSSDHLQMSDRVSHTFNSTPPALVKFNQNILGLAESSNLMLQKLLVKSFIQSLQHMHCFFLKAALVVPVLGLQLAF